MRVVVDVSRGVVAPWLALLLGRQTVAQVLVAELAQRRGVRAGKKVNKSHRPLYLLLLQVFKPLALMLSTHKKVASVALCCVYDS